MEKVQSHQRLGVLNDPTLWVNNYSTKIYEDNERTKSLKKKLFLNPFKEDPHVASQLLCTAARDAITV